MSSPLSGFAALGAQAMLPIILGSYQSLRVPASVKARRRAARRLDRKRLLGEDDEDDDDLDSEMDETITLADSILFPILGSAALLGLWALIKYVDKKWIDLVLGVYFSGMGVFAVHSTFGSIIGGILRLFGVASTVYHVRISAGIKQVFHLPMRVASLISVIPAVALPALYVPLGRPYVLTNVLALCLGTSALGLLRLDGFPTAALLLSLLLVYDIFWVFYTPVMVTVAKGIDAPIKLLAPKGAGNFVMLGLGDVVVPGLLIALCLRFDMGRHVLANPKSDITPRSRFPKPYFIAALVSYVLGLCATVYAVTVQNRAQPALLYLSPACILGPALLAVLRGELGLLWSWREEDDDVEVRDETIEAPSEVAQQARLAAKAVDNVDVEASAEPVAPVVIDDSWMESEATPEKPRKRKGGKKK